MRNCIWFGEQASSFRRFFLLPLLLLLSSHFGVQSALGSQWLGAEGQVLPFSDDSEILDFLLTAEVVSKKRVGSGVNNPFKVLLERDGIRAHAVFRDVRVDKKRIHLSKGVKHDFRDDAMFEVAAYRLGRLLGITNIPPVVVRRLFRKQGTLQIWVEKAMTEKSRIENNAGPSEMRRVQRWQVQTHTMRAFDCLIYNEDRNQGNILYDSNWNLWMIDHTRAFSRYRKLLAPERVWKLEKGFLERLRILEPSQVKSELVLNCKYRRYISSIY